MVRIVCLLYFIRLGLVLGYDALEACWAYAGPDCMLLLSIYVLYSNVNNIYPGSCQSSAASYQLI